MQQIIFFRSSYLFSFNIVYVIINALFENGCSYKRVMVYSSDTLYDNAYTCALPLHLPANHTPAALIGKAQQPLPDLASYCKQMQQQYQSISKKPCCIKN